MWVKSWPEALLQWQSAIVVSLGFSRSLEEEAEEVLFFILNLSNHLRLLRVVKDSAKGGGNMIPARRHWFEVSEPSSMIIVVLILCLWRRSFRLIVAFQWFLMAFSVQPGMNLAMSAHLLPRLLCADTRTSSSSLFQPSRAPMPPNMQLVATKNCWTDSSSNFSEQLLVS